MLQCVAVCCSVLQHTRYLRYVRVEYPRAAHGVAVCCSVLQCVAVCCNTLGTRGTSELSVHGLRAVLPWLLLMRVSGLRESVALFTAVKAGVFVLGLKVRATRALVFQRFVACMPVLALQVRAAGILVCKLLVFRMLGADILALKVLARSVLVFTVLVAGALVLALKVRVFLMAALCGLLLEVQVVVDHVLVACALSPEGAGMWMSRSVMSAGLYTHCVCVCACVCVCVYVCVCVCV